MVGQYKGGDEQYSGSGSDMDSPVTHGGDSYAPAHLGLGETYDEASEAADVSEGDVERMLEGGNE